jgi:HD superfamily phosphodiesterase
MSLIGDVFHDIGHAAKDIVGGALHAAEGAASLGKALLTLNPRDAADSLERMAGGAAQAAGGAATLTPEGLAATTMMDAGVEAVHALSSATPGA